MLQELLLTLLADLCPWSDLFYPNEYCTDLPHTFFETTRIQHGMPGLKLLEGSETDTTSTSFTPTC